MVLINKCALRHNHSVQKIHSQLMFLFTPTSCGELSHYAYVRSCGDDVGGMPNATIWNQSSKERMENVALLVARKGEWDKMLAACRMQQFGINLLKKEWKMLHYWRQGREREDDGRRRMGCVGGGVHIQRYGTAQPEAH